jgi:hypothetical protein
LLLTSGFTPVGSTPEALTERIARDSEKWARVLRIMREQESKK